LTNARRNPPDYRKADKSKAGKCSSCKERGAGTDTVPKCSGKNTGNKQR
jgi:hypothetical protein